MFTGIIKATATVEKAEKRNGSLFLTIEKPKGWKIKPGDSIATDGVCLTATKVTKTNYLSQLMPETLRKTYFGKKTPRKVNLEKPLQLSDGLDGHLVLGHIDAIGQIKKVAKQGLSRVYTIGFPSKFTKLVAEKGSVTVDGISLTVVDAAKSWFTVSLVAYTLEHTTLGTKRVGDWVNIEFDVIAKYLNRIGKNNMHQAERAQFEKFDGSAYRVGIVVAEFNRDITETLLASAKKMLTQYKVPEENITVLHVAGSIEIPLLLQKLAETKNYDCLIAIGAVIKGETAHFDYVAKIISDGVLRVSLDFGIPIGFSVLTTNTLEQARARLEAGAEAVEAAMQSAKLVKELR